VVLEETPFYGESGGQIGDRGRIFGGQFEGEVFDAQKKRDVILHRLKVWRGELRAQEAVTAEVEEGTRRDVVRHHSATHLLQQALRFVLGEQVRQLGSLVSVEKLRIDFSFPRALTPEEIERVEREVNKRVLENYPTQIEITDVSSARQKGALAFFGEKYGGEVRLVTMGESRELCGGTHVRATGDIGLVKILSESSVSSGVRRIEAVAGLRAYDLISKHLKVVEDLGSKLKTPPEEIVPRIEKLETRLRELEKGARGAHDATPLLETSWPSGKYEVVVKALRDVPPNKLKEMCDALRQGRKDALFILSSEAEGRLSIVVGLNPETAKDGPDSNLLVKKIAARMGGTGGGRKDLAQGGGNIPENYESFVEFIRNEIKALCK